MKRLDDIDRLVAQARLLRQDGTDAFPLDRGALLDVIVTLADRLADVEVDWALQHRALLDHERAVREAKAHHLICPGAVECPQAIRDRGIETRVTQLFARVGR